MIANLHAELKTREATSGKVAASHSNGKYLFIDDFNLTCKQGGWDVIVTVRNWLGYIYMHIISASSKTHKVEGCKSE